MTGFDYVEGYEYDIDVTAVEVPEPPEDAPTVRYSLIRVNSKVRKDSDVPTLYREIPECLGLFECAASELNACEGDMLLSEEQMANLDTKSLCIKIELYIGREIKINRCQITNWLCLRIKTFWSYING